MGFSCSPLWCNLYLHAYEINFIRRLARLNRYDLLCLFQHTYRYMDDLCCINNLDMRSFLDKEQQRIPDNPFWIYPLNLLEIKPTSSIPIPVEGQRETTTADFLDTSFIWEDDHNVHFRKFDKRRDLDFQAVKYISLASNRPVRQSYKVMVSQLIPIIYRHSQEQECAAEISTLISDFANNGFEKDRLWDLACKTMKSRTFPGSKVDARRVETYLNNLRAR